MMHSRYGKDSLSARQAQEMAHIIAFGPVIFQVSRVMLDYGIFDYLRSRTDDGATVGEVAQAVCITDYAAKVLLESSLTLGTVLCNDGRYSLSKVGWFFLTDPIEDWPRDWADYKKNYEATFTAKLLYPDNDNYEVMPWPERIYEGLYKKSADSDEKIRIPRFYSTQMQVMINALNQIPLSNNEISGSKGLSVLMANSLMFQRTPEPVAGYDDPQLSNFYGQALPFLKRSRAARPGMPQNLKRAIRRHCTLNPMNATDDEKTHDPMEKNGRAAKGRPSGRKALQTALRTAVSKTRRSLRATSTAGSSEALPTRHRQSDSFVQKMLTLAHAREFAYSTSSQADMAQLVEHNLAKVGVAGSSPVVRSIARFEPVSRSALFISGEVAKW